MPSASRQFARIGKEVALFRLTEGVKKLKYICKALNLKSGAVQGDIIKIFVIGSINMDLVVVAKVFPKKGETVIGKSFFANPGGKGANQAVAVAKMGSKAEMVGAVGREFGDELISALQSFGVSTRFVKKHEDVSSGTATIIVSNGDNRIIINPAANFRISERDVDEALEKAEEGDYLLCQLEIPLDIVAYALSEAKKKKMITFLNPAPAMELPDRIFPGCDYLIPNQTETRLYSGICPGNANEARQAAVKILEKGTKNVLITLGDRGAYFYNGAKEIYTPAVKVTPVDTTGAGDTYIGAFLTMLIENGSIADAMDFAGLAASITIQRMGAQQAIPYRRELAKRK